MSLDKFISSVRAEVAKRFDLKTDAEIDAFFLGIEESAKDNQEALEKRDKMLRDIVAELCEAKRLLKMAVPIINNSFPKVGSCWGCANHDEVNDECKGGAFADCAECAADYRQLAEWLTELKEAMRLLKMAVEDLEKIAAVDECSFPYCDSRCPFECIGQCEGKHWKHLDEALKLIGEDENET